MRKNEDNSKRKYVKIWGEHINLTKFLIGLALSVAALVVILFILSLYEEGKTADQIKSAKLVYGLIGIILVFAFNIKFIRPKRNVHMKEEKDNDN